MNDPKKSWSWRLVLAVIAAILGPAGVACVCCMLWTGDDHEDGPETVDEIVVPYTPGWVNDREAIEKAVREISKQQGFPADDFGVVFGRDRFFADDSSPVFFWTAEEKVLGRILPSLNQGQVGSCVAFGYARGVQDLMLLQIMAGQNGEEWPGAEIATEPIYGGSRVEVGGGRLDGDGSTGAWAARWVQGWGILIRQKYLNKYDLRLYDEVRCREYGRKGVPDELEPIARQHPVQGVAMVKTAAQAWQAVGSGYPIPVCSDVGFQSPLKEGFCARKGNWSHCMLLRARFVHPTRGKCFVIQNSWGNYLASGDPYIAVKGMPNKVRLPQGCFAVTWNDAEAILRQRDSYAISAFKGFPARRLDWYVRGPRPANQTGQFLRKAG